MWGGGGGGGHNGIGNVRCRGSSVSLHIHG